MSVWNKIHKSCEILIYRILLLRECQSGGRLSQLWVQVSIMETAASGPEGIAQWRAWHYVWVWVVALMLSYVSAQPINWTFNYHTTAKMPNLHAIIEWASAMLLAALWVVRERDMTGWDGTPGMTAVSTIRDINCILLLRDNSCKKCRKFCAGISVEMNVWKMWTVRPAQESL